MITRILIVDDSQTIRQMMRKVLDVDPELTVIGEAADGIEAVQIVRKLRPDLITMDIVQLRDSVLWRSGTWHHSDRDGCRRE